MQAVCAQVHHVLAKGVCPPPKVFTLHRYAIRKLAEGFKLSARSPGCMQVPGVRNMPQVGQPVLGMHACRQVFCRQVSEPQLVVLICLLRLSTSSPGVSCWVVWSDGCCLAFVCALWRMQAACAGVCSAAARAPVFERCAGSGWPIHICCRAAREMGISGSFDGPGQYGFRPACMRACARSLVWWSWFCRRSEEGVASGTHMMTTGFSCMQFLAMVDACVCSGGGWEGTHAPLFVSRDAQASTQSTFQQPS